MADEFAALRINPANALAGTDFRIEWQALIRKGAPCFTLVKRIILGVVKAYLQSGAPDLAVLEPTKRC
ncbi:MAG: hypothetical protein WCF30_03660 [Terracidiphilus sp.]